MVFANECQLKQVDWCLNAVVRRVESGLVPKFLRQQRLSSPDQFKKVFSQGKKIVTPHLTVIFCANELTYPRIGLAISKKSVGSAVERNQIKRIIRDSFRQQQACNAPIDIVVISRKGMEQCLKSDIRNSLSLAWQKLGKRFGGVLAG